MINLGFQYNQLSGFLSEEEIFLMQSEIDISHSLLVEKAGKGNEFLGWLDLPSQIDETLISNIESDAKLFCQKSELIIILGIGGSQLGSKAIIHALNNPFSVYTNNSENPVIVFAGDSLSQDYHADLINMLDNKAYCVVAISKSGNTTETSIAFRLLKNHLFKKYGPLEAVTRIITITDSSRGSLRSQAEKLGLKSYDIPENVGGRFSVFTPVGLLPVSMAGYNIRELIAGASEMMKACVETSSLIDNPAACYAAIRSSLYRMGYQIELLVNYEPSLHTLTEWWKQLFAESEGKENEGLFPVGADFTGSLHSMGQYIQEGQRILFETVIHIQKPKRSLVIPFDEANLDGLNYLAGKTLHEINMIAALGTKIAHTDGGVPTLDIYLPQINERALGELLYFFQFACGLSGYLSGINPFNQPGVDAFKNNMFALLGKPGFENETESIQVRINEG